LWAAGPESISVLHSGASPAPSPAVLRTERDDNRQTDDPGWSDKNSPLSADRPAHARLGSWRFNAGDWKGERGQSPLLATNVQSVAGFDGNALQVNSTNGPAILKYRGVETDGAQNIDCRAGSIRLLYKPFWSSKGRGGNGPGNWVRLLELGAYTTNASTGWFALSIDPAGTNVWFTTQDNRGNTSSNVANVGIGLGANISFTANEWAELLLTYTNNRVQLWKDTGLYMDAAVSNLPVPPAGVGSLGFTLGSATNGDYQARGLVGEFEILNYPLGRGEAQYTLNNVLSATASSSPAGIHLQWRSPPGFTNTLQRKGAGETSWTTLAATTAWHYRDTNVTAGRSYQYLLSSRANPFQVAFTNYMRSGIDLPPVDDRGKIILLVDRTLSGALRRELDQLRQDLAGDGWTVVNAIVARHDDAVWANNTNNIALIKNLVTNAFHADPAHTRALFIVGHVAIPYSGFISPDGHAKRPWPSDGYYADVDGVWTDSAHYDSSNTIGDGKFDQNTLPSAVELAVGRVDFARLPAFAVNLPPGVKPSTETDLIRQYLNKDHRYRTKQLSLPQRAIVASYFDRSEDDDTYRNCLSNGSRWFGVEPGGFIEGDLFRAKLPCLWGFQGGPGSVNSIGVSAQVYHTSAELANPANEPPIGFYMLKGSYFGEWNTTDNLLRATLATRRFGLGAVWLRFWPWNLETLAMGDPVGMALVRTQNESNIAPTGPLYAAWMGDPTLRLTVSRPPSNLVAGRDGGSVVLRWSVSPEPRASYAVYRSTRGLAGPFIRLTSSPTVSAIYTDRSPPGGPKTYQVRALSRVVTGSGSFTNMSQGIFVTAN
jgi:hypothetical protein